MCRKLFGKKFYRKAQSAMEYLMTYGWAILIIAVVLGALYSLGVFNGLVSAPRAPPGSCHVLRPNGPLSALYINLEGVCSNELPQYVASLPGGVVYNSNDIQLPFSAALVPGSITINAWFNALVMPGTGKEMTISNNYCSGSYDIELRPSGAGDYYIFNAPSGGNQIHFADAGGTFLANTWYMITLTYSASTGTATSYKNGAALESHTQAGEGNMYAPSGAPYYSYIGGGNSCNNEQTFDGFLADFQIYNTSLTQAQVQALYLEGIGGAPQELSYLVGWWPLNGNATDYSGDYYSGTATGVGYISSWTTGYTPS